VRQDAGARDWQQAVDRLRPVTNGLWAAAPPEEQARFLRHLRPWWDIHRHRIAPSIRARIDKQVAEGRLEFAGGRIVSAVGDGQGAQVTLRRRGSAQEEQLRVRRIVNCTGPSGDIARANEPLLDSLLSQGRIRPDRHRLGIEVLPDCRTVSGKGTPSQSLFAVGPLTKAAYWEMVAVPDIRGQVRDLAIRFL
jgi:uncharacterized NAD(P)/FAD-binding protein YdhS